MFFAGVKMVGYIGVPVLLSLSSLIVLPAKGRDDLPFPKKGAIVIAYTTDTNGYLQSCGCSSGQVGGLARRATLMQQLREEAKRDGQGFVFVDGGNLSDNADKTDAVLGRR